MTLSDDEKKRVCPYCDEETEGGSLFCAPCEVKFIQCASCNGLVAIGVEICPHCGVEICTQDEQ